MHACLQLFMQLLCLCLYEQLYSLEWFAVNSLLELRWKLLDP
jgi:hypothetical protein